MASGERKPADAFEPGDRVWIEGRPGEVIGRQYMDGKKNTELVFKPDSGDHARVIVPSSEYLEVASPLPRQRRLMNRVTRRPR